MDHVAVPAGPGLAARVWRYPLVQAVVGGIMILAASAVMSALAGVVSGIAAGMGKGARGVGDMLFAVMAVLVALAIVFTWKAYKRWIEREPDREYAFSGATGELAAGLAGGAALFTLMTGVVWLLGGIEFGAVRPVGETQWAYWFGIALISGFMEETLLRGLLFRAVEKIGGSWTALAVSSLIFGVGHIFNPGATWFAAIAIAMEAGILLGAAYMLTRRLWLAVGLHAAWNFTQGWVFSVPVSGTGGTPIGLIATTRNGPEWLTGGSFGLEASVVAMVVATAAGLVLLWQAAKRRRIVAAPWNRSNEAVRIDVDADPHSLREV